jgi:hypothetical protein
MMSERTKHSCLDAQDTVRLFTTMNSGSNLIRNNHRVQIQQMLLE